MTDISKITYEDYLEYQNSLMHFGVKGMKWGVRKDDKPTPKKQTNKMPEPGSKEYRKLVAKALFNPDVPENTPRRKVMNAQAELALNLAKQIPVVETLMATSPTEVLLKDAASVAMYDKNLLKNKDIKKAIAGHMAYATANKVLDSGAVLAPYQMAKNALRGGWKKKPELAEPGMSIKDIQEKVIKPINPDYPGLGTTNNCMRCTYAYEMRRRGYNVKPSHTIKATGQTNFTKKHVILRNNYEKNRVIGENQKNASLFMNKFYGGKPPKPKEILDTLSKEPNGSRGELQMSWGPLAGGHSVAYEIVDNKAVVIDAQSGKVYKSASALGELTKHAIGINYTRLDNKDLNTLAFPAWLRDAKE